MKYTFGESFGLPPKFNNYVDFDIDLTEEEAGIIRTFLKENGDCDYVYLESINGALFEKINDAANEAILKRLNEDRVRQHKKKLDFFDIDWSYISYDFYWPQELIAPK